MGSVVVVLLALLAIACVPSLVLAQNTTAPFVDPCPLPLRFNPAILNCSAPCIVNALTVKQMNGIRVFMIVMGWVNVAFLGSIIGVYTVMVPKKWIQFPSNMMLIELAVSILYQTQFLFSTGKSFRGYVCKNAWEQINHKDLVCSWQGAWGTFWAHVATVWICMLGLQLFLTVNRFFSKVSGKVKLFTYLGITFGTSLVSVLICHFRPDAPWGIANFGYCTSLSVRTFRWAFLCASLLHQYIFWQALILCLVPITLFAALTHFFLVYAAVVVYRKSGNAGLRRQARLLLFAGTYIIMIDWIIIYGFLSLDSVPDTIKDIFKWIGCSAATGNSPSCRPKPQLPFAYQVISAVVLSTISTAIALTYSLTSETVKLFGTMGSQATSAVGLSTEMGSVAGTSSGSKSQAETSASGHVDEEL